MSHSADAVHRPSILELGQPQTPAQAIEALKAGNRRFMNGLVADRADANGVRAPASPAFPRLPRIPLSLVIG